MVTVGLAGSLVLLSGCSTAGRPFNEMALSEFVPGQTTYSQAVRLFEAEPVNTYSQLNGGMLAQWEYKVTVLTDAAYFRRNLVLRFSPDGRFETVVDSNNVLSSPQPANSVNTHVTMPPPPSPVRQPNPELEQTVSSQTVAYPLK
jgi:hypothetical protein